MENQETDQELGIGKGVSNDVANILSVKLPVYLVFKCFVSLE